MLKLTAFLVRSCLWFRHFWSFRDG